MEVGEKSATDRMRVSRTASSSAASAPLEVPNKIDLKSPSLELGDEETAESVSGESFSPELGRAGGDYRTIRRAAPPDATSLESADPLAGFSAGVPAETLHFRLEVAAVE
jgi:hypothetical protein